jgi:ribonuclease HII
MIAGVDEAGRGPLAGPVVAGAVILHPKKTIAGLKDSKLLNALQRDALYDSIVKNSLAYACGMATVEEIEELNILQASLLAMQRAINALVVSPQEIWVDGRDKPKVDYPVKAIIDGDATVEVISAASIIAKVTRDRLMLELDQIYPGYGFAAHKGYGTKKHLEALKRLGPSAIHRRTFKPVAEVERL